MRQRIWWGIALLLLASAFPAYAGEGPMLSRQTYQVLKTTQEWLNAGATAKAVKRLKALVKESDGSRYDQAVVLQTLAHAQLVDENYAEAIVNLKRSLGLGVLPDEVQQGIRFNLAQLYMATERFAPAIDIMNIWLRHAETPRPEAYMVLGSAYYQLKRFKDAIPPMRKAVELARTPKENWYQALLSAYNEVKDYRSCVSLLHTMLKLFPDRPIYWRQLAGLELAQEHYSEALSVMELGYLGDYLKTERDLRNLAQLYTHCDAPYRAAQVIEQGIAEHRIKPNRKNLELEANAWYQAREYGRATAALERAVAADNDPKLGLRLAQLYISAQRWGDAERRLQRILDNKKLKDKHAAKVWLLLGVARYEQHKPTGARTAFAAAGRYASTRSEAEQWLAFLGHDG